jgi:hypothetical protein
MNSWDKTVTQGMVETLFILVTNTFVFNRSQRFSNTTTILINGCFSVFGIFFQEDVDADLLRLEFVHDVPIE